VFALLVAVRFAAPIVSLYQVRSKRERHLPFAAGFVGSIGPRINSPDTGSHWPRAQRTMRHFPCVSICAAQSRADRRPASIHQDGTI